MHGNTALHLAVMLGRMECVQLLLAHGAPVKLKNRAGWSPLAEAIRSAACLEHFYGKSRGGQRYFFWGCAFARMLPFFIRPLALDRNDFKFASALSAIPL